MRRRALVLMLLFGPVVSGTNAAPSSSYDPMQSPRLLAFRKKINFDAAVAKEKRGEQVVVDWSTLPPPTELDGWTLKREISRDADGTLRVYLDFSRGKGQVNVKVEVCDPANNKAPDLLLLKADAVTTMQIQYVRGPEDLGTFSLVSSSEPVHLVYWIHRNAYAEVSTYKTSTSALTVARWLQKQMQTYTR